MLLNISLEALHDSLGFTDVASSSHGCALHPTVHLHEIGICGDIELFALTTNLHLLGDNTKAFSTIERGVLDLSLEGEVGQNGHIDILHL